MIRRRHLNRSLRLAVALVLLLGVLLVAAQSSAAAPGPPDSPQWWFDSWQVPSLWAAGARGQGVTIAEIDTGVNGAVPELAANLLPGKDFGDPQQDGRFDHEVDNFGHGTAMASIMVARPGTFDVTGLAPDAKLLPIAVPIKGTDDASPRGNDQVPDAIKWAVDHGGRVISLSLGGRRDPRRDALPCPQDEQDAVSYAIGKGAIVVAASGNAADKNSPVEEPGVCLGVVSVGAVDSSGAVASFSSRHRYLTVTGPGVNVPSLGKVPGTAYSGNGTSQATAVTSAGLALIWSKYPQLTGRQVVSRLLATLDRRTPIRDPAYGFGIVDIGRAITTTAPDTAANPVYDALDPFLYRRAAESAAPPIAPPPAPTRARTGVVVVGSPPGRITMPVVLGVLAALIAAVGLAVLTVVGLRGRRRAAPPAADGAAEADERGEADRVAEADLGLEVDGAREADLDDPSADADQPIVTDPARLG